MLYGLIKLYNLTVGIEGHCKNVLIAFFFFHFSMQVLDRGEKIELLVDKTENLRSQVFMEFLAL